MKLDSLIKNRKFQLIFLGITSLFTFFSNLWFSEVDIMEARNFITSREIVQSGNWIVTTLNGQYRFEKPPLPSWLTAAVMKFFNNLTNEALLRLPSAILGFITVFYLYRFIRKISKNSVLAFFTSFIYSGTFMITKLSANNTWDFYPYAFMFIGIVYLVEGFLNGKLKSYILSGLALGFSIMSKGPVAPYGMFLPFLIAYGIAYGKESFTKNWKKIILVCIIGLILAAIWPAFMLLENRELFLSVLEKEKNTWSNNHVRPFYFYLSYPVFSGIWIFFYLAILAKRFMEKRVDEISDGKKIYIFSISWLLLSLLLISLIGMKKERYGLPLYMIASIPVGLLGNWYYSQNWSSLKKSDRIIIIVQGVLTFLVALSVPALFIAKGQNAVGTLFILAVSIIFIPMAFLFFRMYLKNRDLFVKTIVVTSGLVFIAANISSAWYLERYAKGKYSNEAIYLTSVNKTSIALPIYSNRFEIEDVWRVGKKIISLKDVDLHNLPEEFIYFGSAHENLESFEKLGYTLIKTDTFTRNYGTTKKFSLYYLKKI